MSCSIAMRRALLGVAVSTVLLPGLPALAGSFPDRPIRIVVPYAAGGSTDQLARAVAKPMSEALGQPIVVDNRPGAGGTIGVDAVVRAEPDGYTLVFGNSGPNALVSLMREVSYDPLTSLQPISTVAFTPMIMAVPANSPAGDLAAFVAYARAQGDTLNFGSTGIGGFSHLTGEYFNREAGTKITHVPYTGGAPMATALLSGELDVAFVTGLDGAALLSSGRARYLAVATPEPTAVVPGLPAIADVVPGFQSVPWFGLLAPKGIPPDVLQTLNQAVVDAVADPQVHALFASRNVEARSSTPDALAALLREEQAQWTPVVRDADIRQ